MNRSPPPEFSRTLPQSNLHVPCFAFSAYSCMSNIRIAPSSRGKKPVVVVTSPPHTQSPWNLYFPPNSKDRFHTRIYCLHACTPGPSLSIRTNFVTEDFRPKKNQETSQTQRIIPRIDSRGRCKGDETIRHGDQSILKRRNERTATRRLPACMQVCGAWW